MPPQAGSRGGPTTHQGAYPRAGEVPAGEVCVPFTADMHTTCV